MLKKWTTEISNAQIITPSVFICIIYSTILVHLKLYKFTWTVSGNRWWCRSQKKLKMIKDFLR